MKSSWKKIGPWLALGALVVVSSAHAQELPQGWYGPKGAATAPAAAATTPSAKPNPNAGADRLELARKRADALAGEAKPDEATPNRATSEAANGERPGDKKGDEAPGPVADGDGVVRLKDQQVVRLRPEDIPMTLTGESPVRVIQRVGALPRPPSLADLQKLQEKLKPRVFELVAVVQPPAPYRSAPMVYRGHAFWISDREGGARPVLISTMYWLEHATALYIVPSHLTRGALDSQGKQKTPFVSLDSAMAGSADIERLEREREQYIPVKIVKADRWRNLVQLDGADARKPLVAPKEGGLLVFDTLHNPLSYAFGYSPLAGDLITPAAILPKKAEEEELSFYFQTTYPGVLASPLVTQDGEVIVVNAMHHPKNHTISLAVPPLAFRHFVRERQGLPSIHEWLNKREQADRPIFKRDGDDKAKDRLDP